MRLSSIQIRLVVITLGALSLLTSESARSGSSATAHGKVSPEKETQQRLEHAKELMGGGFAKSKIKHTEKFGEIDQFVLDTVRSSLPAKWRSRSEDIAQAINEASIKYELDPIFILAVIQSESTFNPDRRGSAGEIGLMQILPSTGAYIAHKMDLRWDDAKTLADPVANVQLGSAYISYLRNKFANHSRLYLSAYNMGSANVKRALNRNIWPKDYAARVMHQYLKFYDNRLPEFAARLQSESDNQWQLESVDALSIQAAF